MDSDNRKGRHAEVFADLGESAELAGSAFGAIDRDHKTSELDVGCGLHYWHRLSDRCAGAGDIFDPQHFVAIDRCVSNEYATLAMFLGLFAIEGERYIAASAGECDAGSDD